MKDPLFQNQSQSAFIKWTVCVIASIGFAFDIYELLMLPLILRPALQELINAAPGTPDFEYWRGMLFFVPAVVGGMFGLLGGYLTDLWGRRRVLVLSILLYAFSAMACGFVTSVEWLLFFRCTVFIGVCVEFVAAVAWLAELFPEPKQREAVLGYTQAFSSIGGLLVTGANYLAIHYAASLPEVMGGHEAWRYTVISGVIPALPLILIRPFLPESPAWAAKKALGTLKRPRIADLFSPELRRTTIVSTLMFACSYGAAFGALQQTPSIIPDIPQVRQLTVDLPVADKKKTEQKIAATVNSYQEFGGLLGRFALATLAMWVVSRRWLFRIFQWPGLILVPLVYFYPARDNLELLKWGIFAAGFFYGRTVQLLGQLFAASIPVTPARDGRKFCGQYWRSHVGNFLCGGDRLAHRDDAVQKHSVGRRCSGLVCLPDRRAAQFLAAGTPNRNE